MPAKPQTGSSGKKRKTPANKVKGLASSGGTTRIEGQGIASNARSGRTPAVAASFKSGLNPSQRSAITKAIAEIRRATMTKRNKRGY